MRDFIIFFLFFPFLPRVNGCGYQIKIKKVWHMSQAALGLSDWIAKNGEPRGFPIIKFILLKSSLISENINIFKLNEKSQNNWRVGRVVK